MRAQGPQGRGSGDGGGHSHREPRSTGPVAEPHPQTHSLARVSGGNTQGSAGSRLLSSQLMAPGLLGLAVCQGLCGPQPKAHFPNYTLGPRWGQPGGSCRPGCRLQRQFPALGPQETPDPPDSPAAVVLSTYAALCRVGTSAPHEAPKPGPMHRLRLLSGSSVSLRLEDGAFTILG